MADAQQASFSEKTVRGPSLSSDVAEAGPNFGDEIFPMRPGQMSARSSPAAVEAFVPLSAMKIRDVRQQAFTEGVAANR